jgi:DinB family protein
MTAVASRKVAPGDTIDATLFARVAEEGYGNGAWHGPDLRSALVDVPADLAYWRPAKGRHNIAEIAVHHAYQARAVRERLTGTSEEPFILEGDDWFEISNESTLEWSRILNLVAAQQEKLVSTIADIGSGRVRPATGDIKPFDLILGITCHAVYHAGQIQLIKRLHGA